MISKFNHGKLHKRYSLLVILVFLLTILPVNANAQADSIDDDSAAPHSMSADHLLMQPIAQWVNSAFMPDPTTNPSLSASLCESPECFWIAAISEETGRPALCPVGYAVDGMQCTGRYCDNVALRCRQYTATPESYEYIYKSGWLSEERPRNIFPSDSELPATWYVIGLECSGRYCDNVRLWLKKSSHITNSGTCWYGRWFSEEKLGFDLGSIEAQSGIYVAGLQCSGRYCDNKSLYYCRAQ
ncbi:MAG: hypothetical protein R3E79_36310 [Caldilineaceae bacterium]